MRGKKRDALIVQLRGWHDRDEHQKIIDAIGKIPRSKWDYELAGLYARALNNLKRYEEALETLLPLEEEGKKDGVWYFRVAYSLYYLNREAEAAEYFQKAIDYGDDGEDTREFLKHSLEEAAARERGELSAPGSTPEMYTNLTNYTNKTDNIHKGEQGNG